MTIAKSVAAIGFLFMLGMLIYAFTAGDFFAEWDIILSQPWGIGALADLYTGLVLFAGWVAFRERSWWKSLIWFALLMSLGFIVSCLYIFIAAMRSGNDWQRFWLGKAHTHA